MQLSLTFTGINQRGAAKKWHIILHFYNKFETKHQETLSGPAKLIPIKAPGNVPAVLLLQIAQSITRFMRHSKVKYPININMYRNQLFTQFSTSFLSSIEGRLIEDDVCFLCETSVCLLECKISFPFGTVMGKPHVPIHKGTFIAVNSFSCQF